MIFALLVAFLSSSWELVVVDHALIRRGAAEQHSDSVVRTRSASRNRRQEE